MKKSKLWFICFWFLLSAFNWLPACWAQPPGFKSIHQIEWETHEVSTAAAVLTGSTTAPLVNPIAPLTKTVTDHFVFAVLGDNRPSVGGRQPWVYRQTIEEINELKPSLVINTGDLIQGTNDKVKARKQFAEFVEVSRQLTSPLYIAIGNHDVGGNRGRQELYLELICPKLYYSFDFNFCHFIFLDSEVLRGGGMIVGEQLEWLEEDLANIPPKTNHIFVSVHRPLFPVGPHRGSSLDRRPMLRDELLELFAAYKVKAIFCGHEHLYHKSVHQSIEQYITGGGGAPLYRNFRKIRNYWGARYHYLVVKVYPERYEVEVRTPEGYPSFPPEEERIEPEEVEEEE